MGETFRVIPRGPYVTIRLVPKGRRPSGLVLSDLDPDSVKYVVVDGQDFVADGRTVLLNPSIPIPLVPDTTDLGIVDEKDIIAVIQSPDE